MTQTREIQQPAPDSSAYWQWRQERWREYRKHQVQLEQQSKRTVPVQNDIPWYLLMGTILVGAALLSYGMTTTVKRWAQDLRLTANRTSKATVVTHVASIFVSTGLGAVVGYLVWHWALGLATGFVGVWSSSWILNNVGSFLSRWKSNNPSQKS